MTREKAIEVVKEAMPTLWKETKDAIQTLIPELAENEDERMRKEAISIVQSYMNICDEEGDPCLSGYEVLAWLEKQKESTPVASTQIGSEKLKAFKERLADIIVSSQGLCTYGACKDRAEDEASILLGIIGPGPSKK